MLLNAVLEVWYLLQMLYRWDEGLGFFCISKLKMKISKYEKWYLPFQIKLVSKQTNNSFQNGYVPSTFSI